MGALNTYLQQTQRLLGDPGQARFNLADLTFYINEARRNVAAEGQCVRFLPAISGPLATVAVTSGGSGYVGPATALVSAPDMIGGTQATVAVTVSGGAVTAATILSAGGGYFAPAVTISSGGPNAAGAVVVATTTGLNTTIANQEIYPFAGIVLTSGAGLGSILAVNGISVLWGTIRYTLNHVSFSRYQAQYRNYTSTFQSIPWVWAQYGQGIGGTVYLYPVPDQAYQMEWDCLCLPADLAQDSDPEAIPDPWRQCVPYFAAYLALMADSVALPSQGGPSPSDRMFSLYQTFMRRARAFSGPGAIASWYQRVT